MTSTSDPAGSTASSGSQFVDPAVYAAQNPGTRVAFSAMQSRASSRHLPALIPRDCNFSVIDHNDIPCNPTDCNPAAQFFYNFVAWAVRCSIQRP